MTSHETEDEITPVTKTHYAYRGILYDTADDAHEHKYRDRLGDIITEETYLLNDVNVNEILRSLTSTQEARELLQIYLNIQSRRMPD